MIQRASISHVDVPQDVTDFDTFRTWARTDDYPENGRVCYLAGEIYVDMNAEDLHRHNKCKGAVYADLLAWNRRYDLGELFTDGAFFANRDADLATVADITFCSWASLDAGRVSFREWTDGSDREMEVTGSPDLVVEVLSPSSIRKDTRVLPELYFDAGVREYWIIDPREDRCELAVHTRGDDAFELVQVASDGFTASGVLAGAFRLCREKTRRDTPRFRLQSRVL